MSSKLPKAYSEYGASMGRSSHHASERGQSIKLHLERVRLDSGGYDNGGAYWGSGDPLWYAHSDNGTEYVGFFFRARDRAAAKAVITTPTNHYVSLQHSNTRVWGFGYTKATFYR